MNTVVGKLLDVDRQARQTLDEAQQYYDKTIEEIDSMRKGIYDKYNEKARLHLEQIRESEAAGADEKEAEIRERCVSQIQKLEDAYNENREKWEQELFDRVINGGDE